jgi:hypothetical protein
VVVVVVQAKLSADVMAITPKVLGFILSSEGTASLSVAL